MSVKNRYVVVGCIVLMLLMSVFVLVRAFKPAQTSGISASALIINPAGGIQTNGSDGVRWEFNRAAYSRGDGVFWRNKYYFYDGGDSSIVLTVGGGAGRAIRSINTSTYTINLGNTPFDDIVIGNLTGSAITCSSTSSDGTVKYMTGCGGTTGSGSGVITYSKTLDGRLYQVVRTITYTYPEQSYLDQYDVIIPAGNTSVVKLYKGGDTTPGSQNTGVGAYFSSPVRSILSIEVNAQVLIGMKEVSRLTNMSTFEGAVEPSHHADPYSWVVAGQNLNFSAANYNHNVGYMIQYNIGDDPDTPDPEVAAAGTYREENINWVAQQGVSLEASWQSQSVLKDGQLDLSLSNTFSTQQTGLGYRFTLPSPLYTTDIDDFCGGTTTITSGSIIDVSGVKLDGFSNCVISVKVGRPTAGTATFTGGSVSNMTSGMKSLVGSSMITFTQQSDTPTPSDTPSPTLTNTLTPSLTPSKTPTFTQTFTPSNTPTRTPSFTRSSTPTRSDTYTRTSSRTRTPSYTRTPTNTHTSTSTYTATHTASNTPTSTHTYTPTITDTPTFTPSNTRTSSKTRTVSPSNTVSPSVTLTPTSPSNYVVKSAIGHGFMIGILGNGSLVAWGRNNIGQVTIPSALRTKLFIDVSASIATGFAIDGENNLYSWGANDFGERDIPVSAQTNVKAVDGGGRHVLALKTDGTVVAWGRNNHGQTNVPPGLSDVIAIAAGDEFSLALTSEGRVVAWGNNSQKQALVPAGLSAVTAIAAGTDHALALRFDGTVVGWGSNAKRQLAALEYAKNVIQIGAGREYSVLLRADGTLYAYGNNYVNTINFPKNLGNVQWLSASWVHTVVGFRNGSIQIFGSTVEDDIYVSRTPTITPLITETASLTSTPSLTLTPSRTLTASPTNLPTRTPTFKR